jgi:hypothetical protein
MPKRRADATEDAPLTPETGGEGEVRPEAGGNATETDREPLPAPGAESEPEQHAAPPEPPVEAVTVDEAVSEPAAEPLPEPAAMADAREEPGEEHHEEEGMSWPARLLTALVLLIAGAALGIWGAPKLAPLLPSGLKPVADWLAPGRADSEAEIAALKAELDAGIGGVETRLAGLPSGEDIDARAAAVVEAAESKLSAEIAALKEAVSANDATDIRQRLDRLEAGLEGRSAELQALKDQLSGAAAASGQLNEEAVARIDVYKGQVDGLRAEMGSLGDKVAALATRVDEVAAEADRQIETARSRVGEIQAQADTALSAAETDADLALIRAAVASGAPFADPLGRLAGQGEAVPEALSAAAPTGVETMAELRDSYPDAAHAAIRASILAGAGEGVLARSRAYLAAQVASRSLTPQQGVGTDAVLSRMEERLRQDDLAGVLEEARALPSEAAAAMAGWLDAARLRADAVAALAALGAEGKAGD